MQFCNFPRAEQLEEFVRYSEERARNKIIRQAIARPKREKKFHEVVTILDNLREQEARHPGLIDIQISRRQYTLILLGQDILTSPHPQAELKLT